MTWQERLNSEITLSSPDGDFFTAKWKGNTRSFSKKLGLFNYPKVKGTKSQDLDSVSDSYPLTLYFDGVDNDKESERFFNSCKQIGPWEIDHPTKGLKTLQLVDIEEAIQPIDSGGITVFRTNWIEVPEDEPTVSDAQLEDEIGEQIYIVNMDAVNQFVKIIQDTASKVAAVKNTINKAVSRIADVQSKIASTVAAVESEINSIQRGIQDTLDAVILNPLKLAGQIQGLIQLPGLIVGDFQARLSMYTEMADEMLGLSPDDDDNSPEAYNTVLTQELTLSAILAVTPVVGATSEYKTRKDSLLSLNIISGLFASTSDRLDLIQKNFETVKIEQQYFSQSQSYNSALKATALSNQLLTRKTFDLKVQRTLILKQDKTPLRMTLEEYGYENFENNYDLFLTSNNLSGNDILLLRAGREVVVYV